MNKRGFSVVEVLLSVVLLALFVMATVTAILYGQEGNALTGARNRAAQLASEGLEADRNIRDANFSALTIGTYGLSTASGKWNLTGSSDQLDIFTRTQSIATASGSDDERDVTSSATWQQNLQRPGIVSIYARLTNWFRKFGNWASPSLSATINLGGTNNGVELTQKGRYVYLIRAGGTPEFVIIDVNIPDSPVVVGSTTLTGNAVNIEVSGNYAYVTTDSGTAELQIVNISNPAAPAVVGTFNATGTSAGSGVFVVGTTVYMTTVNTSTNNFVILNASNPASPTQLSVMSLPGPLHELTVMGNLAYLSSDNDTSELRIVDVSNPNLPVSVGTLNLPGTATTLSITGYQNPNTIFTGRGDGTVNIVDVSSPSSPTLLSTFSAGGSTNDVNLGLSAGYLIIASSNNIAEFRTIDISTLSTPTNVGTLSLTGPLNAVIYDQVRDRVYGANPNDSSEFIVIKPL